MQDGMSEVGTKGMGAAIIKHMEALSA